jgi:hypothetical protein
MAWTLDELLKINEGNTNLYTPYSNPGVYTRNDTPKINQADMLSQLLANPDRGLLSLDQEIVASNQNNQWNAYGYYSLGPDGKLARTDAGTLKADLGQGGALSGTLNTPYGQVTPYYEGATTAGNGNDRWASYGLYDSNKQKVGNAGTLHYDIGGGGWAGDLGTALSLGTGGISDMVTGHTPFNTAIENASDNLGLNENTRSWLQDVSSDLFSGGFAQLPKAYAKATEGGGFQGGAFIDRAVDPAGTIDYTVRELGDAHRAVSPELTDNAQQIGSIVGGVIGSIIPAIGTGVGAAVGSGIGSKTAGGTKSYDYTGDLTDAGVSYVAAEGVPNISGPVGDAVTPYIGQAGGKIVGGAAQGGLRGAAGGVKPAVESGSIDPIWKGAATGAVLGGVSAGGQELYSAYNTPSALDIEDQALANKYNKYYPNTVSNQALGIQDYTPNEVYGIQYQEMNPSFTPFTVNPELQYAAFADPLNSYMMGGKSFDEDKLITDEHIKKYPNTFTDMARGIPSLTPDEMYAKTYSEGHSILPDESSWMDNLGDYAKRFGNALLDNIGPIRDLAGKLLNPGGDDASFSSGIGEDGNKGRPAMEQDWLAALLSGGGVGKGKSKGLDAGYVDKLKYDPSLFMPNKRVKKYTDTGLYE